MTDCNAVDTRFEQFCTSLEGKNDAKINNSRNIIEAGSPSSVVSENNAEDNRRELVEIDNDDKFDGKIFFG